MSNEPPELDPVTAERLIAAVRTGELDPDLMPLAELLAAATAPARPDDLTGMDAALAAFRLGRRPARGALVGRALSLQGLAVTLVVGVLGGGALAAASAALPVPLSADRPVATTSPAETSSTATPRTPRAAQVTAATAPPRQTLAGWCRAVTPPGKQTPPAQLVEAAGGRSRVPAFCARLLRVRPNGKAEPNGGQSTPKADRPSPPAGQPSR